MLSSWISFLIKVKAKIISDIITFQQFSEIESIKRKVKKKNVQNGDFGKTTARQGWGWWKKCAKILQGSLSGPPIPFRPGHKAKYRLRLKSALKPEWLKKENMAAHQILISVVWRKTNLHKQKKKKVGRQNTIAGNRCLFF